MTVSQPDLGGKTVLPLLLILGHGLGAGPIQYIQPPRNLRLTADMNF